MAKKQRRRAKPRVGLEQVVAALDAVERQLIDIRMAVATMGVKRLSFSQAEEAGPRSEWPGESCLAALAAWPGTACRTPWPGDSCKTLSPAPASSCTPLPSIACFSPWPGDSCGMPKPGGACKSWPGASCHPPIPDEPAREQKPRMAKKRTRR
jgi:hypothetical protein